MNLSNKTSRGFTLIEILIAVAILILRGPAEEQGASTIVVTGADLLNVQARFNRTWQREPTDAELRRSLEQHGHQVPVCLFQVSDLENIHVLTINRKPGLASWPISKSASSADCP